MKSKHPFQRDEKKRRQAERPKNRQIRASLVTAMKNVEDSQTMTSRAKQLISLVLFAVLTCVAARVTAENAEAVAILFQ